MQRCALWAGVCVAEACTGPARIMQYRSECCTAAEQAPCWCCLQPIKAMLVIMHAGAYKDARPIKVVLAEEVPAGANGIRSDNVGVRHEMDPAAAAQMPYQQACSTNAKTLA
jgi:hypothetical protein